jgi:hypothetical protein
MTNSLQAVATESGNNSAKEKNKGKRETIP